MLEKITAYAIRIGETLFLCNGDHPQHLYPAGIFFA